MSKPTVKEFKHIPGENDLEYIKLLKEHSDNQRKIINKAIAKIKALSAERKKGKWITYDWIIGDWIIGAACCSVCGYELKFNDTNDTNFCPNCGSDMRGEQDDTD